MKHRYKFLAVVIALLLWIDPSCVRVEYVESETPRGRVPAIEGSDDFSDRRATEDQAGVESPVSPVEKR